MKYSLIIILLLWTAFCIFKLSNMHGDIQLLRTQLGEVVEIQTMQVKVTQGNQRCIADLIKSTKSLAEVIKVLERRTRYGLSDTLSPDVGGS